MISPEDVIQFVCVYSRPAGCGFSCPYLTDGSSSAPDAGAEASGCPAGTCRQTLVQKNQAAWSLRSAGESSRAASLVPTAGRWGGGERCLVQSAGSEVGGEALQRMRSFVSAGSPEMFP